MNSLPTTPTTERPDDGPCEICGLLPPATDTTYAQEMRRRLHLIQHVFTEAQQRNVLALISGYSPEAFDWATQVATVTAAGLAWTRTDVAHEKAWDMPDPGGNGHDDQACHSEGGGCMCPCTSCVDRDGACTCSDCTACYPEVDDEAGR